MSGRENTLELRWPGSERQQLGSWARRLNKVFQRSHLPVRLGPPFDHYRDMVSLEQAGNLQLLLDDIIAWKVKGAVVELGCYTGSTSAIIGSVLMRRDPDRPFHVFDRFDISLGKHPAGRHVFEGNLRALGIPLPQIHPGDVMDTVPRSLPDRIAFAHFDLGVGGDQELQMRLMNHSLKHVYERLSPGGVLVFMDYHVPGITVDGNDSNPGVRSACDLFFKDKQEKVVTLYGGPCSHGFVRKQC